MEASSAGAEWKREVDVGSESAEWKRGVEVRSGSAELKRGVEARSGSGVELASARRLFSFLSFMRFFFLPRIKRVVSPLHFGLNM